jgi:hypothetical protein
MCVVMPIRLHCDCPGCERSIVVAVSPGTGQFDLRHASDWWVVATTSTNSPTVGCCQSHLNLAFFDRPVTQVLPEVAFAPADVG